MYAKLFRNTITNGKSQTLLSDLFFFGERAAVHRLLALQIANFETAKQAVEKTTPKADQRKGELLMFFGVKKNEKLSQIVRTRTSIFFRFPLILHNKGIVIPEAKPKNRGWDYSILAHIQLQLFFQGAFSLCFLLPATAVFLFCSEHFLGEL